MIQGAQSDSHSIWYVDNGASHHVMRDPNQLLQAILYHGSDQLHIGNGQGLPITSFGHSTILNIPQLLHLKNILHVPKIRMNLLFVHKFTCDNYVYFKFYFDCCLMKDKEKGRELLKRMPKDGLYHLALASTPPQAFIGKKTSPTLWHSYLRHPSFRILKHVLNQFGLPSTHINNHFLCDFFCLSKLHHLSHLDMYHQTHQPLTLVHSDLWGPIPPPLHLGFLYYVIFVDDYSKYKWLYTLKWNSDVFDIFQEFHYKV